jgi:hypothetical protein
VTVKSGFYCANVYNGGSITEVYANNGYVSNYGGTIGSLSMHGHGIGGVDNSNNAIIGEMSVAGECDVSNTHNATIVELSVTDNVRVFNQLNAFIGTLKVAGNAKVYQGQINSDTGVIGKLYLDGNGEVWNATYNGVIHEAETRGGMLYNGGTVGKLTMYGGVVDNYFDNANIGNTTINGGELRNMWGNIEKLTMNGGAVHNVGTIDKLTYSGGIYNAQSEYGRYYDGSIGTLTLAGDSTGIDWGNVGEVKFASNGAGILSISAFAEAGNPLTRSLPNVGFSGINAENIDLTYGNVKIDLSGLAGYEDAFFNTYADGLSLATLLGMDEEKIEGSFKSFQVVWEEDFDWGEALLTFLEERNLVVSGWNRMETGQGLYWGDLPGSGSEVPEPATLAILGLGLAGLGLARARRRAVNLLVLALLGVPGIATAQVWIDGEKVADQGEAVYNRGDLSIGTVSASGGVIVSNYDNVSIGTAHLYNEASLYASDNVSVGTIYASGRASGVSNHDNAYIGTMYMTDITEYFEIGGIHVSVSGGITNHASIGEVHVSTTSPYRGNGGSFAQVFNGWSGTIDVMSLTNQGQVGNDKGGYIGSLSLNGNGFLPLASGNGEVVHSSHQVVQNYGTIGTLSLNSVGYTVQNYGTIGTLAVATDIAGGDNWGKIGNLMFHENGSGLLTISAFAESVDPRTRSVSNVSFLGIQADKVDFTNGNIALDLSSLGTFGTEDISFLSMFSFSDLFGDAEVTGMLDSFALTWDESYFFVLNDGEFGDGWNIDFTNGYVTWDGTAIAWTDGAAVPEPATLAVLALGLAGLGLARARRRK